MYIFISLFFKIISFLNVKDYLVREYIYIYIYIKPEYVVNLLNDVFGELSGAFRGDGGGCVDVWNLKL